MSDYVSTVGFKVLKRHRAVDASVIERFRSLPVANVSDAMHRMSGFGPYIRPYHRQEVNMCGPALTVRCRPGDNMMFHVALSLVAPGDIVVVDCGGDLTNSISGERMMGMAQRRGCGGFVINGAIRDLDWVRQNDFPVFAAGIHHRGPLKSGPGEVNVPISIGGQIIHPGDLVIGDADGALCVPFDDVEAVYVAAKAVNDMERESALETDSDDQEKDRREWLAKVAAMGAYVE